MLHYAEWQRSFYQMEVFAPQKEPVAVCAFLHRGLPSSVHDDSAYNAERAHRTD